MLQINTEDLRGNSIHKCVHLAETKTFLLQYQYQREIEGQ